MKKIAQTCIIVIIACSACRKDNIEVIVPATIVNYAITDSMHLSVFTMNNFPQLYNNYNDKTYSRETNKVKSNYTQQGSDIILIFEDTSVLNLGTEVSLKILNKNLANITGSYSAPANIIFYEWHQTTSANSAIFSAGYFKADTFNMQIAYDDRTKTLSGNITNLKYPFGVYVPYYLAGSPVTPGLNDGTVLSSEGSFRKHTIKFQYVKSL